MVVNPVEMRREYVGVGHNSLMDAGCSLKLLDRQRPLVAGFNNAPDRKLFQHPMAALRGLPLSDYGDIISPPLVRMQHGVHS